MAMLDDLRKKLSDIIGSTAYTDILDLWDRYLHLRGVTAGTLYERQKADAAARGFVLQAYLRGEFDEVPAVAPDAPTGVTAARSASGEISVSYVPPLSDGGAPITSYRAISTPGSVTATGLSNPLVVTGL